ncbi:MAG TPA: DUF4383 domain-containing protein [Candidatus Paceibacterota bacterium]
MAKTTSWVFGIIFVIAGIWGLFSHPAAALGFIAADITSSIIHLVVGLILLALANKASAAMALKIFGIIYILWAILGFASASFTAIDTVTTWFYLVVGIVIAILGFASKGSSAAAPAAPAQM